MDRHLLAAQKDAATRRAREAAEARQRAEFQRRQAEEDALRTPEARARDAARVAAVSARIAASIRKIKDSKRKVVVLESPKIVSKRAAKPAVPKRPPDSRERLKKKLGLK